MPTATRVDALLGAVGSSIIARWMARIKGASRRSRGHYSSSALQGLRPLARQVAGGYVIQYGDTRFPLSQTTAIPLAACRPCIAYQARPRL